MAYANRWCLGFIYTCDHAAYETSPAIGAYDNIGMEYLAGPEPHSGSQRARSRPGDRSSYFESFRRSFRGRLHRFDSYAKFHARSCRRSEPKQNLKQVGMLTIKGFSVNRRGVSRHIALTCSMKYDDPISSMRAVCHSDWPIVLPITFEHEIPAESALSRS